MPISHNFEVFPPDYKLKINILCLLPAPTLTTSVLQIPCGKGTPSPLAAPARPPAAGAVSS